MRCPEQRSETNEQNQRSLTSSSVVQLACRSLRLNALYFGNSRLAEAMISHIQAFYEEYEGVCKTTSVLPTVHLAEFINSGQHPEHSTKCDRFAHAVLGLNVSHSTQRAGCDTLKLQYCAVFALRNKKAFVHSDMLSHTARHSEEVVGKRHINSFWSAKHSS